MPSRCACGECDRFVKGSGIFVKGHQPAGTSNDPLGKQKAANDANDAKVQQRAREEAEERIAKMPKSEPMLTEAEAAEKAEEIMECVGDTINTSGCTVEEWLGVDGWVPPCMDYPDAERDHDDDSPFVNPESGEPLAPPGLSSFYVGYTARAIPDEALRWLTVRGASQQAEDGTFTDPTARNRPVLLFSDGSTISMKRAQEADLGFTFFEVYSSTLMINARYVEKALQKRYQHLPLGLRLWRHPDKGKKYDKEIDGKLHKVYITCSPRVAQMLAERKIKVDF